MSNNEVVIASVPSRDLARVIVDALVAEGIRARVVVGSPANESSRTPQGIQISCASAQQEEAKEILRFLKGAIAGAS